METTTEVTRFIRMVDVQTPPETLKRAAEECDAYTFQRAGEGCVICIHEGKAYPIIKRGDKIGCGCADWTLRCKDNEGCKHVKTLMMRQREPSAALDREVARDLIAAGWISDKGRLQPPEMTSDEEGEECDGGDPIPGDPPKREPVTPPGMNAAKCRWCGQEFEHTDAVRLLEIVMDHEEYCEKKPELGGPGAVVQESCCKYGTEDEKMSKDKPAWNQEAWNIATQGRFATFDDNGVAILIFTANDFETGKPDRWSRTTYEFSVIQNDSAVILSVGAIRLMIALKAALPLEGKQIKITKSGEGTGTQYRVEDIGVVHGEVSAEGLE